MSRKELVEAYAKGLITRRDFLRKLTATGVSLGAALTYANILSAEKAGASPEPESKDDDEQNNDEDENEDGGSKDEGDDGSKEEEGDKEDHDEDGGSKDEGEDDGDKEEQDDEDDNGIDSIETESQSQDTGQSVETASEEDRDRQRPDEGGQTDDGVTGGTAPVEDSSDLAGGSQDGSGSLADPSGPSSPL